MSALLVIMPMMSGNEARSSSLGILASLIWCFSHSLSRDCKLFKNAGVAWPTDSEISHMSFPAAYLQTTAVSKNLEAILHSQDCRALHIRGFANTSFA